SSPFAGAWEGLDKSVIIANWYSSAAPKNMPFFEKRGHRQIIAGYYDSPAIKENLKKWLDVAEKHKGQTGVIYTTWSDNFTHMEQFYKALQELIGEEGGAQH
ncbi:hypothetical protein ACFL4W_05655, partial [Planctomycetota bacterium]